MAKTQCIDATISDIKQVILENDTRDTVKAALEKLEEKMGKTPIRICIEGKSSSRGKSKYNMFISECLKGRAEGQPVTERMKVCAVDWRKQKGK